MDSLFQLSFDALALTTLVWLGLRRAAILLPEPVRTRRD